MLLLSLLKIIALEATTLVTALSITLTTTIIRASFVLDDCYTKRPNPGIMTCRYNRKDPIHFFVLTLFIIIIGLLF